MLFLDGNSKCKVIVQRSLFIATPPSFKTDKAAYYYLIAFTFDSPPINNHLRLYVYSSRKIILI